MFYLYLQTPKLQFLLNNQFLFRILIVNNCKVINNHFCMSLFVSFLYDVMLV
jgi:hypothetical protein